MPGQEVSAGSGRPPATESMACSSTLQPISRSSGVALSISLWLMPSSQGTKIMPVGATVADLAGVVPGAGDDVLVGVPEPGRGLPDRVHAPGIELDRRLLPDLVDGHIHVAPLRDGGERGADLRVHLGEDARIGVADVDREPHLAGNGVARVGAHVELTHRADRIGRLAERDVLDRSRHPRRRHERVLAGRHRRGAGVRVASAHLDVVPALALGAAHHADGHARRLEDRTLLDVGFEQRAQRVLAAGLASLVADARKLVAERLAFGALQPVGEIPVEQSREHPGGDHRGGEARALLVGPVDDLDRGFGLDSGVVEGAHRLQRGQHPEDPVELAAVGLGVEVTAGGHRRQIGVPSRPPREHVPHLVHGDRAARLLAPGREQVTPALVVVGQREPAAASAGQGADLRHLHDARPQPVAVYT